MHCTFAIKGLLAEVAANQIVEVLLSIFPSLVYPFVYKAWFYGFVVSSEFVLFCFGQWCFLVLAD
jgi:hypothetical protein